MRFLRPRRRRLLPERANDFLDRDGRAENQPGEQKNDRDGHKQFDD